VQAVARPAHMTFDIGDLRAKQVDSEAYV